MFVKRLANSKAEFRGKAGFAIEQSIANGKPW